MSSGIDQAAVRHVAHLARLKVTEDEVAQFAHQLSDILAYVELLNEVDTSNVEPTAHAGAIANVFREDSIAKTWTPEQALANAPDRHESFFRVPKVLDQESA